MTGKKKILRAYKKKALFTVHALNQMNLSERMISKDEYLAIITAYIPDPTKWEADMKTRR